MAEDLQQRTLNRLQAGAAHCTCGEYLSALDALHRSEIFITLAYDRLERKYKAVQELFTEANQNWNQTFYLLYFRTLGDKRNQEAYLELARRVPYAVVLRERCSRQAIEAMFFGCSGLLDLYHHDTYTLDLRRDFEHLAAKYNITPLSAEQWDLSSIRPANHPVLRIAQAAAFFIRDEFVMQRTLECQTEGQVNNLFRVEASTYWSTHHIPGVSDNEMTKRIGNFKANLLGINLVAILQYAYGSATQSETLRQRALSLQENLPAEENLYIKGWQGSGLSPRNAFESQALLQLATEYCAHKRCLDCPVGRRILLRTQEYQ